MQSPELRRRWQDVFGGGAPGMGEWVGVWAPGRVNLIGEHTDYNEGWVCPIAIERGTMIVCRGRSDFRVRVHSEAMGEMAEFSLEAEIAKSGPGWGLYVRGVAEALRRRGVGGGLRRGMDAVVASDVPVGAGLSSSAALEVATGLALLAVNGAEMNRVELALACQWAEHTYAGMPCGIMDQFICALGERGRALLLDCRDRTVRQVALNADGVRVVVANSGVKHALVGGEYANRRRQCGEAVAWLGRIFSGVRSLRDATMEMLEAARVGMDQTVYRRARHVITENARTVTFAAGLERGDFAECGALMYGSHASLRDDYEVSCAELDVLVEIARGVPGVYGARMTGGGFGGCIVALVQVAAVEGLEREIEAQYRRRTGRRTAVFATTAREGARVGNVEGEIHVRMVLADRLKSIGQADVLRFVPKLDEAGKNKLFAQLGALDLDALPKLIATYVIGRYSPPIPQQIQPITPLPRQPRNPEHKDLYARALARGKELLKEGKVGAFVVAGGQGTRLGYNGPKGAYPVTPIKNKPLFQVFAEQLMAHGREAVKVVPWYIMTSDANDAATRSFFAEHQYFGYEPSAVFFLQQGMMPAFSQDGQLLLAANDSLALSPDGHGGSLRALKRSGALEDMKQRGVKHLSYFQVDNPIVHCIDPLFIGLHDLAGSEMSSKTIGKAGPLEKVGNFCFADSKLQVIEYSDLPDELAYQTNAHGGLKYNAGSIAIHALRVSFIDRLNAGGQLQLSWHGAEKKVPYLDAHGNSVKPDRPNAIKLEQFVFDAVALARNPLVYTTERAEEFSPVKNAEGADSPATCRRDQVSRFARWLKEWSVQIPYKGDEVDAIIEISPLYAATVEQFKARKPQISAIRPGSMVYFGEAGVEFVT